jgi:hypothetical protein
MSTTWLFTAGRVNWVNLGGSCNGRCLYILWPFGLFYGHLVFGIWSFGIFSLVLVCCTKKNLATPFAPTVSDACTCF